MNLYLPAAPAWAYLLRLYNAALIGVPSPGAVASRPDIALGAEVVLPNLTI